MRARLGLPTFVARASGKAKSLISAGMSARLNTAEDEISESLQGRRSDMYKNIDNLDEGNEPG